MTHKNNTKHIIHTNQWIMCFVLFLCVKSEPCEPLVLLNNHRWERTVVSITVITIWMSVSTKINKYPNTQRIREINLSTFVYRPLHEDFSPILGMWSIIFVYKALHWALYHVWFQNKPELYISKYNSMPLYEDLIFSWHLVHVLVSCEWFNSPHMCNYSSGKALSRYAWF